MNTTAIYPASFDLVSNGHLHLMQCGAKLFDKLIICIGSNSDKKYTFSLEQRIEMLNKCIPLLNTNSKIEVTSYLDMYAIDYATKINATHILRGVRNLSDYEYELQFSYFNEEENPNIQMVWIPTPKALSSLSSSFIKGLTKSNDWERRVEKMVPKHVFELIKEWKNNG